MYVIPTATKISPMMNESVANPTVENNERMKNDDTERSTSTDNANPWTIIEYWFLLLRAARWVYIAKTPKISSTKMI